MDAFLERQRKTAKTESLALSDAIGKAGDLLIGKGITAQDAYNTIVKGIAEIKSGQLDDIKQYVDVLKKDTRFRGRAEGAQDAGSILSLEEKQRLAKNEIEATEAQMYRLAKDISSGTGLELAARLGIDIDRELQVKYEKALDNLQKAKIDYFHGLAEAAVGKEGAIGTAVFSRKFPAVMKKATVAIVDRTDEFAKFRDNIKALQQNLPEDAQGSLSSVISEIDSLSKEHGEKISKQIKAGFPVLNNMSLVYPQLLLKNYQWNLKRGLNFQKKW